MKCQVFLGYIALPDQVLLEKWGGGGNCGGQEGVVLDGRAAGLGEKKTKT